MRRVLVTGGAGFIGSNFIHMVIADHEDTFVLNLDKLTYAGNLENLRAVEDHARYAFVRGDICDEALVTELLSAYEIDSIVNFAAESHVDRSITGPRVFVDTNVGGTLTLLLAAKKQRVRKFVQVSTDEVYGSLGADDMFTEQSPLAPSSPYSASKTAADHFVCAFGQTYGLPYNITRCSNNYGPYQFPEKLIPLMMNNALDDKPLPVYGDGLQVRDWLYVLDHCRAIWKVLTEAPDGEIYNIGGCNEKTNLEVVRTLLGHLNKPESLIQHVTDRPGHDRRYAIDASKISEQLGWEPTLSFEQGLKHTIDWYQANGDWLRHLASGEYQTFTGLQTYQPKRER